MNDEALKSYDILLVDDDEMLAAHMATALQCFEFRVFYAQNAGQCYEMLAQHQPSVILLDLGLPQISGYEICEHLREKLDLSIPILILSGKRDEAAVVRALESGADDFIPKNSSFDILLARVRAAIRRGVRASVQRPEASNHLLEWGKLMVDRRACQAFVDRAPLELTHTEFKLLELFMNAPGMVYTRDQIIEKLHGVGHHLTPRTIDVHINALRAKLGQLRQAIETVRSVGYRFAANPP